MQLELYLTTLIFILAYNFSVTSAGSVLHETIKQEGIIPDLISELPESELTVLKVTYEDKHEVNLGNSLIPSQLQKEPTTLTWNGKPDKFYLLIMTDPDAPSRMKPTVKEFKHWVVVNIPGDNNWKDGEVLAEYKGPAPPKGSGLHRYTFLVYEQPGRISFSEEGETIPSSSMKGRMKFSTTKFIKKYGMTENNLVAINFFISSKE